MPFDTSNPQPQAVERKYKNITEKYKSNLAGCEHNKKPKNKKTKNDTVNK